MLFPSKRYIDENDFIFENYPLPFYQDIDTDEKKYCHLKIKVNHLPRRVSSKFEMLQRLKEIENSYDLTKILIRSGSIHLSVEDCKFNISNYDYNYFIIDVLCSYQIVGNGNKTVNVKTILEILNRYVSKFLKFKDHKNPLIIQDYVVIDFS